jgi:peptidoglycan/LPS O-acetylase OafA/YrhL
MLIAMIFLYVSRPYFNFDNSERNFLNMISGLTFIDPNWWDWLLHFVTGKDIHVGQLEGAYWSLYIEMEFYVIFGFLYFISRRNALVIITILYGLAILYVLRHGYGHESVLLRPLVDILKLEYFGFLIAGAWYYKFWSAELERRNLTPILYAFVCAISSIPVIYGGVVFHSESDQFIKAGTVFINGVEGLCAGLFIITIFMSTFEISLLRTLFSSRLIVFFGFISYPLYLIHEHILIGLVVKIHHFFPNFPNLMTPIPPIMFLIIIAFVFAAYIEPFVTGILFRRTKSRHLLTREEIST